MQKTSILFFGMLFISLGVIAQKQVVEWSFDAEKVATEEYNIIFTAEVEKGWYVYSQFLSDDGPIPTSFEFDKAAGLKLNGKAKEEGYKKEGYDEIFGMNLVKFGKTATFTQPVEAKAATTLTGYLTYMTCNDEQCLPPTDVNFSITLPK